MRAGGALSFALYLYERAVFRKPAIPQREKPAEQPWSPLQLAIVCMIAAYFAALCQLLLKSQWGMFQHLPGAFGTWQLWGIVLLFILTDVVMEVFRQRALRDFPALYVVPIISAMLLIGSIVMGGVCFGEFEVLSRGEGGGFAASVVMCVIGVAVLSSGGGKKGAKIAEEGGEGGGEGGFS
ncbi:hypothetical protein TeGR_g9857 [Tetraparma gracilis]|uniref:Uncharacterized protein n=1 Tax=Tetraparma gracilis TaxID=2962635 RepID=A0ABQ6MKT5_9STRA|nr:hypothetical protein TeGR_g9857 [Tetraparma gracilis]